MEQDLNMRTHRTGAFVTVLATLLFTVLFSMTLVQPAYAEDDTLNLGPGWVSADMGISPTHDTPGWHNYEGLWFYFDKNGKVVKGRWIKDGGKWYYLNPERGAMLKGWRTIDGKKYYLHNSGAMQEAGWFKLDGKWYYFSGSGALITGWKYAGGKWYYLNPEDGAMQTGWTTVKGKSYYLHASGAMQNGGWFKLSGKWYYIDNSGARVHGWKKTGGKWYYLNPENGIMKTGWQEVKNVWYYLSSSGAMKTGWLKNNGSWYYLNGSGAMAKGWKKVSKTWYYFKDSGAMVTGELQIDGEPCFFEKSGAYVGHGTPIMGKPNTTVAKMTAAFDKQLAAMGKEYPAEELAKGGAANTKAFCQIVYDEAVAEGVRPEVLWVQIMHETGWLQFGGDVSITQYNYGGIGATGGGVPGNSFADVRTGIRAQVQHLKCYGSTEPLKKATVDPRWWDNLRGKAKLVEWLGIQENPYGTGWAASQSYGYTLVNFMKTYLGV